MTDICLDVQGVSKRFGGLEVISDLTLRVREGERHLILGPNGAGKTTLFNLLGGEIPIDAGEICLFGARVQALSTARRAALGVARTYQILTLFGRDTMAHNVALAAMRRSRTWWNPLARFAADEALREEAMRWLEQVELDHKADQVACLCSYGEQRRLEIAIALAQKPRLMLLDEPLAGLSAQERAQVVALLRSIPRDISIVMIEHDIEAALALAERVTVLHRGRKIAEGDRDEVLRDPRTKEVYLGH